MERDFVEEFKVPTRFPDLHSAEKEKAEEEDDAFPLFLFTEPRGNDTVWSSDPMHLQHQWWDNSSFRYPGHRPTIPIELLRATVNHVIVPIVCLVGILGNAFNFYVFYRRWYQKFMNDAEKSVTVGLMSLSVSDAAFCLAAVPGLFLHPPTGVQSVASLRYAAVYRPFLSNLFLLNSTWLIVTVSVQRLVAVTWSSRGRRACVAPADPRKTAGVHAAIFVAALTVCLPLLLRHSVVRAPCDSEADDARICYHVRPCETLRSAPFVVAYQVLWTVLGTAVPLVLLVFCNARLIAIICRARYSAALVTADRSNRVQVTVLVVATVVSFVVLVCPSMVVDCLGWLVKEAPPASLRPAPPPSSADGGQGFLAAVTLTNLLQAVKFSFNFLLYCTVSRKFRRELKTCSRINDSCRPTRVDQDARVRLGCKR